MTLIETMVMVTVMLIFTSTASAVFIQVMQASDTADARVAAVSNCRFLLDTLAEDLTQASLDPSILLSQLFVAADSQLAYGDLVDNDGDGAVDEEAPDGADNDGDWSLSRDDNDLRVLYAGPPPADLRESGWQAIDLGDGHVDEDVVFNSDSLSFWIPGPAASNVFLRQLTYGIETFEGEDNVVVRRVRTLYNDLTPETTETGPLAFEVVSLNFLMWDHRLSPPNWVETWTSGTVPTDPRAPVAVYARVAVHGDTTTLQLPPARAMNTVSMATITTLESVLMSPSYPR